MEEDYYTPGDIAEEVGVARQWIHEKYIAEGIIVHDRRTRKGTLLFEPSTVERFLRSLGKPKRKG